MGDKIYYFAVLKLFFRGYKGINKLKSSNSVYNNLMLYSIMNQQFIGKRFFLSPMAKDDDGLFECQCELNSEAIEKEIEMNQCNDCGLPLAIL